MPSTTPKFTQNSEGQLQWRAPTLQQPNNLQGLIKSKKIAIRTGLSCPSVQVAKTIAVTGADWCWIDAGHIGWSQTLLVECIQIIIHESGGKMIPITEVRVPSKTAFDYMAWVLDAGAGGIIIPHIDTPEEFRPLNIEHHAVQIPGVTDLTPEGETIFSVASKHVAIIPQIESRVGIQNLDAILAVEEISAFMIGAAPNTAGDLRLDMGLSLNMTGNEPEFVAAMNKATKISKARDLPILGVAFGGAGMVQLRIAQGFRIIAVSLDLHALAFGIIGQRITSLTLSDDIDMGHLSSIVANITLPNLTCVYLSRDCVDPTVLGDLFLRHPGISTCVYPTLDPPIVPLTHPQISHLGLLRFSAATAAGIQYLLELLGSS
ncbi:Pyruvate/Phosphoenolpyruvate kinase-like domain-containing protein [Mycena rebaudengoi]|nr:Pyruvate/Phosphoenolpyruvate kinase-like domain-containing protein [Mycena rebaudengoi]